MRIEPLTDGNIGIIKIRGIISEFIDYASDIEVKLDEFRAEGITKIKVSISSVGGSYIRANEIITTLKKWSGKMDVELGAICAGAASFIACSFPYVIGASNLMMVIERPTTSAEGNEDDFEIALRELQIVQDTILETYMEKTGKRREDITRKWKLGWWLRAWEAHNNGFINEVDNYEEEEPDEDFEEQEEMYDHIPAPVLNRIRAMAQMKSSKTSGQGAKKYSGQQKHFESTLDKVERVAGDQYSDSVQMLKTAMQQDPSLSIYDALRKHVPSLGRYLNTNYSQFVNQLYKSQQGLPSQSNSNFHNQNSNTMKNGNIEARHKANFDLLNHLAGSQYEESINRVQAAMRQDPTLSMYDAIAKYAPKLGGYLAQQHTAFARLIFDQRKSGAAIENESWTFEDYQEKAPQLLEKMRNENPARFQALKDLHYNNIS